jgi:uncharacterized protein YjbJ (UPF0337 family)
LRGNLQFSFADLRRHHRNVAASQPLSPQSCNPHNIKEYEMNWDRIEGNWKEFKGKAKAQWGKLTDDDLTEIDGRREELSGRLQQRYGYAKDEVDRHIDSWMTRSGM